MYDRLRYNQKLLTRDDFRNGVFKRDGHACVVCGSTSGQMDAHHIIERRLFHDGGYYLDNGVTLCSHDHILAEKTVVTVNSLRNLIGVEHPVIPEHLYGDYSYDKWGNILLTNGSRIQGELYHDESVQKILRDIIGTGVFIPYIKYPRTYHVPWTGSNTTDDRTIGDMSHFGDMSEVVVTEKMDGENATIYSDGYFHARSIDGNQHPSQTWLINQIQNWWFDLPTGWRVCGENLYATHSIKYDSLDNLFQVFSIWDENNMCLSWDETVYWCELLGLSHVGVLYRGVYDEDLIRSIKLDVDVQEGYVIRNVDGFHYSGFRRNTAKYVRFNHIQSTVHNWRSNWDSRNINKVNGD
jgi:hypothetical protein